MTDTTKDQHPRGSIPTTADLREFSIAIEWRAPTKLEVIPVIARSLDDAKAIAVTLFKRVRTPDVIIEEVKELPNAN